MPPPWTKAAPGARVVKAFNTLGAEHHADPKLTGKSADVFMASDNDDDDAKKLAGEVATRAGFTPIDFGPLRNAAVLDNVAMRWIHLATVGGHPRNLAFAMQRSASSSRSEGE